MAFLPPKVTYDLNEVKSDVEAGDSSKDKEKKYEFTFMPEYIENGIGMDEKFMKNHFESFYTKTKRGNKIACLYISNPKKENIKYTILFSHGNAADLGMLTGFYCRLVHQLNVNLFSYDYSGYGRSSGKPSEKNLYSDIEAAWQELTKRVSNNSILLYGQSIGTAPVVDLATKVEAAGVVLHSPLMSGIRLLFPTKRTWICDAFPIIDKISMIKSPTLGKNKLHSTQ